MMRIIVDRFEKNIAVCEILSKEARIIQILRHYLPYGCDEGDVLVFKGAEWHIDKSETLARKKCVSDLVDELFE